VQRGLKVVLDKRAAQAKGAMAELKSLLKPGGKGTIVIAMAIEERGREVEFALPGRFDISPAQQGAISTVPGVVEVVEV
jgi:DNA polymerase-3 subunit alpha